MKNKKKYLILLFFLLILILFHKFGYIGHYCFDDMQYAKIAHDFLNGNIDYNDHYSYRLPTIVLTALSYSIFGISDFASSIAKCETEVNFNEIKNNSILKIYIWNADKKIGYIDNFEIKIIKL